MYVVALGGLSLILKFRNPKVAPAQFLEAISRPPVTLGSWKSISGGYFSTPSDPRELKLRGMIDSDMFYRMLGRWPDWVIMARVISTWDNYPQEVLIGNLRKIMSEGISILWH